MPESVGEEILKIGESVRLEDAVRFGPEAVVFL